MVRVPLVVILGATGSGKTKLSLAIAKKYSGEILSADSMQVYTGLDIITAKATSEERSLAPHHLLDVIDPWKNFTVVDFRNRAVSIIDDLLQRNKMPIVVGGTNYYIESILWNVLVEKPNPDQIETLVLDETSESKAKRLKLEDTAAFLKDDPAVSSLELHEKLKELDPKMADQLHPNNRRKILRALQVLAQKGRKLSDILEEQRSSEGGCTLGGSLRYPNSLIFWLRCEQDVLDKRLDDRVDSMVEQGLLQELTDFHKSYNEQRIKDNQSLDYTRGVFQSIGFKEFHEYLMLDEEQRKCTNGCELFTKGLNDLKLVTRRYARRQNKWVKNRFLGHPKRQVPPVYGLDTTDVSKWLENVEIPAINIIQDYIDEKPSQYEPLPIEKELTGEPNAIVTTHFCEICNRKFIGDLQWSQHINSDKHKRVIRKMNRIKEKAETSSNEDKDNKAGNV